jgi:hypothetical protein
MWLWRGPADQDPRTICSSPSSNDQMLKTTSLTLSKRASYFDEKNMFYSPKASTTKRPNGSGSGSTMVLPRASLYGGGGGGGGRMIGGIDFMKSSFIANQASSDGDSTIYRELVLCLVSRNKTKDGQEDMVVDAFAVESELVYPAYIVRYQL